MSHATITPTQYVLSLSPDYVKHWGFWEAIRELLQNSIDQQQVDSKCEVVFDYDNELETLTVGSTNCKLSRKSLLLGNTTKANSTETIGCFGEGYKLAILVLTRALLDVEIHNGDEIWRPYFKYSDKYESDVLVIDVLPAPYDLKGVAFRISGVPESLEDHPGDDDKLRICYDDIHQNYLINEPNDKIFDEEHMSGRVFIKGLFVCRFDDLHYGYNFAPHRISLDRDRRMISEWDVKVQASYLWQADEDEDRLFAAVKAEIPDVEYVTLTDTRIENRLIEDFQKEHIGAIPIASQKEAEYYAGQKTCFVPKKFRDFFHKRMTFTINHQGTPTDRLERFFNRFKLERLCDTDPKNEFLKIIETSKHWTGPADV